MSKILDPHRRSRRTILTAAVTAFFIFAAVAIPVFAQSKPVSDADKDEQLNRLRQLIVGMSSEITADDQTPVDSAQVNRAVTMSPKTASPGQKVTIPVTLDGAGDEVAISFTLNFDPTKLRNPVLSLGSGVPADTSLMVNYNYASGGRLMMIEDSSQPLGSDILTITFEVAQSAPPGDTVISFANRPTPMSISNANSIALTTNWSDGHVNISAANRESTVLTGRVLTPFGSGLRNATVTLVDQSGASRSVMTSAFGYFTFEDVAVGSVCTIAISSKKYRFDSTLLNVTNGPVSMEFTGTQ